MSHLSYTENKAPEKKKKKKRGYGRPQVFKLLLSKD